MQENNKKPAPGSRIDISGKYVIHQDSHYQQHWMFSPSSSNISYELDDNEYKLLKKKKNDLLLIERMKIEKAQAAAEAQLAKKSNDIKDLKLNQMNKSKLAENRLREYKWRGNNLALSNTPVQTKPRLLLREFQDHNSHLTNAASLWYRTPRDPVQKSLDYNKAFGEIPPLRGSTQRRKSLTEPSEYSSVNSTESQGLVFKSISKGRR